MPIIEVGHDHGQWFFSMKLMEGGSLASATWPEFVGVIPGRRRTHAGRPWPAPSISRPTASGFVHRNLKPANVLLNARTASPGQTDFGLAKCGSATTAEPGETQPGTLVGTPSYMATEQAAGRTRGR